MVAAPRRALVRPPGKTYPRALTRLDPPPRVDLPTARSQHARYAEALATVGLAVETLPADDERPDAVFVQDRVAVIDGRAIVGPSAVAERRGETEPIAAILRKLFPIVELRAPATLDWGDVLVTEDALFVGLSERSNEAAVRQLRELLAPDRMVEGVAVPPELLHLLSGCAYLGGGALLAVEALASFAAARGFSVLPVPEDEMPLRQRARGRRRRRRSVGLPEDRRGPRALGPPRPYCRSLRVREARRRRDLSLDRLLTPSALP